MLKSTKCIPYFHIVQARVLKMRVRSYALYASLHFRQNDGLPCFNGKIESSILKHRVLGDFDTTGAFVFASAFFVAEMKPCDFDQVQIRHIYIRNILHQCIVLAIGNYQQDFFAHGDWLQIKPYPLRQLLEDCKQHIPPHFILNLSDISRFLTAGHYVLFNQRRLRLKTLLPTREFCLGYKIKTLLIEHPHITDQTLTNLLHQRFDAQVSRRYVSHCRKRLGIPAGNKRRGWDDITRHDMFFQLYLPLCESSIYQEATHIYAAVYELSWEANMQPYPKGESEIIYIGSSSNVRHRLLSYVRGQGHTENIRQCIANHSLRFRIMPLRYNQRHIESWLLHVFLEEYGSLPLLNSLKPTLHVLDHANDQA